VVLLDPSNDVYFEAGLLTSGANLTFESRLGLGHFSNVKFQSSTRDLYLLVVL